MYGPVAAGAKHGKVFGLGLAGAAGQRDPVMSLEQVHALIALHRYALAGLAADVVRLGSFTGQFLGQPGDLGVAFRPKVGLQDLATLTVLKILLSVFVVMGAAHVRESFRKAYKGLHHLRFVGDFAEDLIVGAADGFVGVMAVAHRMPFDADRVKSALCEFLCPENPCGPVCVSTCDDPPCVDVTVEGLEKDDITEVYFMRHRPDLATKALAIIRENGFFFAAFDGILAAYSPRVEIRRREAIVAVLQVGLRLGTKEAGRSLVFIFGGLSQPVFTTDRLRRGVLHRRWHIPT